MQVSHSVSFYFRKIISLWNSFMHKAFYLYQEYNLSHYNVNVIEFQSFNEIKLIIFCFNFGCGNSIGHTSLYLKLGWLSILFVCLLWWDLLDHSHVLCTIGELLVRRGVRALFCGIWTSGVKVIDFGVIFRLKILKIPFTFIFAVATTQGTLVDFEVY